MESQLPLRKFKLDEPNPQPRSTENKRLNIYARSMASRSKKKKHQGAGGLLSWWPVLLGIAVTPFTAKTASVLALGGPWPLRMLYPFAQLLQRPELAFGESMGDTLAQGMMYLQFPLEGLLMRFLLKYQPLLVSFLIVALFHLAAAGLLAWLGK
jgi:hypothetical protein